MGWIIAIIGLGVVGFLLSSAKDLVLNIFDTDSFLGKLALSFFIAAVASWILHFVIASSLMISLGKVFFLIVVVLVVIRMIIAIFKNN